MLKQLDLNVEKPESERLPKLYSADSINMANLRIHFDAKDEAKVWQMLKDHTIMPAIWNCLFQPRGEHKAPVSTYDVEYTPPYRPRWKNLLRRILLRMAARVS